LCLIFKDIEKGQKYFLFIFFDIFIGVYFKIIGVLTGLYKYDQNKLFFYSYNKFTGF